METRIKSGFKAVEYMRQVRNDLATLYQTDKKRFHDELKQTMADFIAKRQKPGSQQGGSGASELSKIIILLSIIRHPHAGAHLPLIK